MEYIKVTTFLNGVMVAINGKNVLLLPNHLYEVERNEVIDMYVKNNILREVIILDVSKEKLTFEYLYEQILKIRESLWIHDETLETCNHTKP
jgi:hypothetical protein